MKSWRFLHGSYPMNEEMAKAYTKDIYTRNIRDTDIAHNHIAAITTIPNNLAELIQRIHLPTLVIHGQEDKLIPVDNGMALARLIPDANLALIPMAGHIFFNEQLWRELAEVILNHIQNCKFNFNDYNSKPSR